MHQRGRPRHDLVPEALARELLRAYRETSPQSRLVLVELAQQLARQRLGHKVVARPTTLMHALRPRIGEDPVGFG